MCNDSFHIQPVWEASCHQGEAFSTAKVLVIRISKLGDTKIDQLRYTSTVSAKFLSSLTHDNLAVIYAPKYKTEDVGRTAVLQRDKIPGIHVALKKS